MRKPVAIVSIFAVSLLVRLVNLGAFKSTPTFDQLDLDARFYDLWAKQIARGDLIGKEVFFMGPLYPYFLASIYKVFGPTLLAVRVVQSVLGSLTAVLTYALASECFGYLAGIVSGLMAALYIPFIYYDIAILLPVLATLLNTAMLFLLCKGFKQGRSSAILLGGIACGISAAGNASVLAFAPVLFVIMLILTKNLRLTLNHFLRFAVGIAVVVMPIAIRNYYVGHDLVLLTSNAGLNFYIGNNEQSTGAYVKPEGMNIYTDPSGKLIAEKDLGRQLKPSEVSDYWMKRSFEFIKARPRQFIYNLVRKFFFFWSVYEIPQLQHIDFDKQFSPVLRLPLPNFGVVCPLGLVGMGLLIRRRSPALFLIGFILAYSSTIILFFVVDRYRLPAMTALIALAGLTLGSWIKWLLGRNYRMLAKTVAAFFVIYVVIHINFFRINPLSGYAQSWYRLGVAVESKGDFQTALRHYRKAAELDPKIKPVYVNIGIILSRLGRYDEARLELRKAIQLDSAYAKAYYNLGLTYSEQAMAESALVMFEKALEIDSQYVFAKVAKASSLYELGNLTDAETLLKDLSKVDLEEKALARQVHYLLDLIPERKQWIESRRSQRQILSDRSLLRGDNLLAIGLVDASRRAYQRALEIDPKSSLAHLQLAMLYLGGGHVEKARDHLLKASELDSHLKGVHLGLAIIAIENGEWQVAYDELSKELEIDPLNPLVHLNLASCYENYLGDIDKAIYHLERYTEIAGATPEVTDRVRRLEQSRERNR